MRGEADGADQFAVACGQLAVGSIIIWDHCKLQTHNCKLNMGARAGYPLILHGP
jgi:hypothetical protein